MDESSESTMSPSPTRRSNGRPPAFLTPAQQAAEGVRFNLRRFEDGTPADDEKDQHLSSESGDASPGRAEGTREGNRARQASNGNMNELRHMSTGHGTQFVLEQFRPPTEKRSRSTQAFQIATNRHFDRQTIKKVRQYNAARDAKRDGTSFLGSFRRLWKNEPQLPELPELEAVVHRAFPPRMDLQILICDIKANSGQIRFARVGDIEKYWRTKPDDVLFRWIHAPLGQGILHSSIEDMFRHDWHRGKAFPHAGTSGFPYVQIESLHFRERKDIQHLRDVRDTLETHTRLTERLTKNCLKGNRNETLESDLRWREKHLHKPRDFWNLAIPDIPDELSESLTFQGPLRLHWTGKGPLDRSSIGDDRDPQFKDAKLVVSPFRFFHRTDGVLLTMSAATGVDQLHKDFHLDIKDPWTERLTNVNASVVANMMKDFADNGAASWYEHSVEYLMVHLITEIGTAPQNIASGRSALSLLATLQGTIMELKKKRYDRWEPRKTVALVEDYLICMDDLKLLGQCFGRKLSLFQRLLIDLETHEVSDEPHQINNINGESAISRVQWAIRAISEDQRYINEMHDDLSQSLSTLFQLRSVEQNELAMLTDVQNRALFVFTGVTVVFLPLSFFTSYYGMNLVNIRNTELGEDSFWKICGTATFGIIAFVVFCAMIYRRNNSAKMSREMETERKLLKDEMVKRDIVEMRGRGIV